MRLLPARDVDANDRAVSVADTSGVVIALNTTPNGEPDGDAVFDPDA